MDDEGHLIPVSKVRGDGSPLMRLCRKWKRPPFSPQTRPCSSATAIAWQTPNTSQTACAEKFGVKNIYINFIGPVIGAHSGPGTVALFFIGEHR